MQDNPRVGAAMSWPPLPSLWLALFMLVLSVHWVWSALNQVPPVWDMAHHQIRGMEALMAWRNGDLPARFHALSDYYPPLYYLYEALIFAWIGVGRFTAPLANLPGLVLLSYLSYRIAQRFLSDRLAQCAGMLPLLLPMVAWLSRETLLDVSLSGWVAAGFFLILRSRRFSVKGWSLLFGVVCAAGMLTKWTFVLFIAPGIAWALVVGNNRGHRLRNVFDAGLLAFPPILWWYLPNLRSLMSRFQSTAQAAIVENDPTFLDWAGWIYYPRVFSSYYFFLPLTALFVWGIAVHLRRDKLRGDLGLIVCWLVGGWVALTLLDAKDPRYIMPLAAPACLLLIESWKHSRRVLMVIFVTASLQFFAVSFALPGGPYKWAAFEYSPPEDYRTLAQEWVFFESQYFDVVGPPQRQDWQLDALTGLLPDGARVGVAAELPRFNATSLRHAALSQGRNIRFRRLADRSPSESSLRNLAYIVCKSGDQGPAFLTEGSQALSRFVEQAGWVESGRFDLPDGSQAFLWKRTTLE